MKLPLSGQSEEKDMAPQGQGMWERLNSVSRQRAKTADCDIKKDTRLKRNDPDTITILHLADIHIDPFYSEVGTFCSD